MRILRDKKTVVLVMRDGHSFEIDCPDTQTAARLVSTLEIGIADIIETVLGESNDGSLFRDQGISQ